MPTRSETASILAPSETYTEITVEEGPLYNVDEAMEAVGMGPWQYKRLPLVAMVGFAQASVLLLPYILIVVYTCKFHLTNLEQGITLSSMMVGNLLGDLLAGWVCDRAGRKPVLVLGTWVLAAGSLSLLVLSDLYPLLLIRIFTLGVGIGLCTFTTIIYMSEMVTPSYRGISITMIYIFWGAGTVYTTLAAFFLLNSGGVRAVVVTVTVPLLVTAIAMIFCPDTPKYLATSGSVEEARLVLKKMSLENGRELPGGVLTGQPMERRGEAKDMFEGDFRRNSILLMVIFFCAGIIFYSGYAMTPYLLQEGYCGLPVLKKAQCTFSTSSLKEAAIITLAEVIMLPFTALLAEHLGRLMTLRILSLVLLLASCLLVWCLGPLFFLGALFLHRGTAQSLFNVLFIYTPELYPTFMRAVSCGVVMSCMTAGGLLASFIVYILGLGYSWKALLGVLAGCALVVCLTTCALEDETQGIPLPDVTSDYVGQCLPCQGLKKKIKRKIKRRLRRRTTEEEAGEGEPRPDPQHPQSSSSSNSEGSENVK